MILAEKVKICYSITAIAIQNKKVISLLYMLLYASQRPLLVIASPAHYWFTHYHLGLLSSHEADLDTM